MSMMPLKYEKYLIICIKIEGTYFDLNRIQSSLIETVLKSDQNNRQKNGPKQVKGSLIPNTFLSMNKPWFLEAPLALTREQQA